MTPAQNAVYCMCKAAGAPATRRALATLQKNPRRDSDFNDMRSIVALALEPTFKPFDDDHWTQKKGWHDE